MIKACFLPTFLLAAAGLLAGCVHPAGPNPQSQLGDSLWARKAETVVQYSAPVGQVPANPRRVGVVYPADYVDPPVLWVEAVKFTASEAKASELAVALRRSEHGNTCYVPVGEIPGLVKAIDRLCSLQAGAPPFENFKAQYRSQCGLKIVRTHPTDSPGRLPVRIQLPIGLETTEDIGATTENLEKFKRLLIEAEKRLK